MNNQTELVAMGHQEIQAVPEPPVTGQPLMVSAEVMEMVIGKGDLSELTSPQRVEYLTAICKSMGLNPLTQPLAFQKLDNKLVIYARKDCAEQLRRIHNVSITIVGRETIDDIYVVTARATLPSGRQDESTGAVNIGTARGEAKANCYLKAETKAKRRVTLSIIGLGFILDETEIDSVQESTARPLPTATEPPWKTKGQMVALFDSQKARVGAETYYRILGEEDVDEVANLTPTPADKAKAARLWAGLSMVEVHEAEVVS